jgi:hypothetical protein
LLAKAVWAAWPESNLRAPEWANALADAVANSAANAALEEHIATR